MKLEKGKCRRNLVSRMTFRLPSDEKIGLKFMWLLYIYIYIYILLKPKIWGMRTFIFLSNVVRKFCFANGYIHGCSTVI